MFQSFWIIVTAIAGFAFYNEWNDFTPIQSIMFAVGITITLYGILLLSNKATKLDTMYADEQDEEQIRDRSKDNVSILSGTLNSLSLSGSLNALSTMVTGNGSLNETTPLLQPNRSRTR